MLCVCRVVQGVFFCLLSLLSAIVLGLFDRRASRILHRADTKTGMELFLLSNLIGLFLCLCACIRRGNQLTGHTPFSTFPLVDLHNMCTLLCNSVPICGAWNVSSVFMYLYVFQCISV